MASRLNGSCNNVLSPHKLAFPQARCDSLLGRLGIYGVSIFFILSGLSMAILYNKYIHSLNSFLKFYLCRIFRIWPLLWAVCFFDILHAFISSGEFSWKLTALNLTTLFGFIKPTAYIPVGAWSIGNEMVYYLLTPIVFIVYNLKKTYGNILLIFTICIGLYFSEFLLDSKMTLAEQWATYINPFNNFFLFVIGIGIYYNTVNININKNLSNILLCVTIILFIFLPFEGDQINIVTGIGRVVFCVLSSLLVFCFYKTKLVLPNIINESLLTFGIATYGVYLIHPVIYMYLPNSLKDSFPTLSLVIISILTVGLAIISYRFFEIKLIKIGKNLASKLK